MGSEDTEAGRDSPDFGGVCSLDLIRESQTMLESAHSPKVPSVPCVLGMVFALGIEQ